MKSVVLDASLALALVLPDENARAAERLLQKTATGNVELITAPHWPLEIANGLLQASRRRRISASDRLIACDFLLGLSVTIEEQYPPASELFSLSEEGGLSAYDACYLALALQRQVPLASADEALRRAARHRGVLWQANN